MLLGKAIPATLLFLLFVRSGVTTSSGVTPSPSTTNSITPGNTTSANVSTTSSVGGANPSTPSASITPQTTASAALTSAINTTGGVTPSPTAAAAQTVNVTASASVADVVWHEWITENPGKCKEQCCDVGGDFTFQIRNCTINRQRCNLDKCENYGAIKREVPCKTACDCMSNAGHLAPGLKTIIATLLICTLIVNMKP